jgi:hypothetical protein
MLACVRGIIARLQKQSPRRPTCTTSAFEVRGLRLSDQLGDLGLGVDALAERVDPVRAELVLRGARLRRTRLHEDRQDDEHRERATH